MWVSTDVEEYSSALTYAKWEIAGVNTDNIIVGDVEVTYYIQFRKPKFVNIAA